MLIKIFFKSIKDYLSSSQLKSNLIQRYKKLRNVYIENINRIKKFYLDYSFKIHRILSITLFFLVINLIFLWQFYKIQIFNIPEENSVANTTIIAPFTYEILKTPIEIEQEKKEVERKVLPIVVYDSLMDYKLHRELNEFKTKVLSIARSKKNSGVKIDPIIFNYVSRRSLNQFLKDTLAFKFFINEIEKTLDNGILNVAFIKKDNTYKQDYLRLKKVEYTYTDYIEVRKGSIKEILPLNAIIPFDMAMEKIFEKVKMLYGNDSEFLLAVNEFLSSFLRPNYFYDKQLTLKKIEEEKKKVSPIKGRVLKGLKIVEKGEIITKDIWEKLYSLKVALEKRQREFKIENNLRVFIKIVFVNLVLIFFYLSLKLTDEFKFISTRNKRLNTLFFIFSLGIFINFIFFYYKNNYLDILYNLKIFKDTGILPEIFFLIPVGLTPFLISQFFGVKIGVISAIYFSLLSGLVDNFDFFIYTFTVSIFTVYTSVRLRFFSHYISFLLFVLIGVNIFLVFLIESLKFEFIPAIIKINITSSIISSIFTIVFGIIMIIILERISGLATPIRLMELSDMNLPLLRELSTKAPGTYHHSILVSQLAEAAAETIGANTLIARVGGLYHDIGKLYNPKFFIENQTETDNIHERLKPYVSATILHNHIKEGVALAKKYNLPDAIIDIIKEHHGTTKARYFYNKAMAEYNEADFSLFIYKGPKPQTKESAIVMIADSLEATARSSKNKSPSSMRKIVETTISRLIEEEQFDEAPLTFAEIKKIKEAFYKKLIGFYHDRVDYSESK